MMNNIDEKTNNKTKNFCIIRGFVKTIKKAITTDDVYTIRVETKDFSRNQKKSCYHIVTFFNDLANIVETEINQGDLIEIYGSIKYISYKENEKTIKYTTIIAKSLNVIAKNKNLDNINFNK